MHGIDKAEKHMIDVEEKLTTVPVDSNEIKRETGRGRIRGAIELSAAGGEVVRRNDFISTLPET